MLGVILIAYREFEDRMSLVTEAKLSKAECVEAVLRDSTGKVTKRDVFTVCPDISKITAERALRRC